MPSGKVLQLNMRYVSKQGKSNTNKPSLLVTILKEVLDFFGTAGVDLRKYTITFDSWSGSRHLIDIGQDFGFEIS